MKFIFADKPKPREEARDFIRAMPAVDRATFDEMLPEFQHGAFLITGIAAHDVLQDVQDIVARTQEGGDFEKIRKQVEAAIEPHLGGQAKRRSLIIVRSAAFRASNAGVTRQLDNHRAAFPFRKRLSSGDGRVRASHNAMHGMTLPADSPFWDSHTPPDAHNCRCSVVGVTRAQAARLHAQEEADVEAGTMLPEERRLASGAVLKQIEGGIINRGLNEQYNLNREPGTVDWSPRSMLMPMARIKERYTPDVWALFKAWAQGVKPDGKQTLWDALKAQRQGNSSPRAQAIQPDLPLPAKLPPARTREQVREALKLRAPAAPEPAKPAPGPAAKAPPAAPGPVVRARAVLPSLPSLPGMPKAARPQPAPAVPPVPVPPPAAAPGSAPAKGSREALAAAKYVSKDTINAGINGSYLLRNGEKVVFKPADEEYGHSIRKGVPPKTQFKREMAASLVADALGINLVPPVALITHEGQTGSAMLFKSGFTTAAGHPGGAAAAKSKIRRADLEAWQLFDDLTNHLDRHQGNWMVKPREDGSMEVALIDNGLSIPAEYAKYPWGKGKRVAVGLEGRPLSAASKASLKQFLAGESALRASLAELLEPEALDKLIDRARLLASRGTYGNAVPRTSSSTTT